MSLATGLGAASSSCSYAAVAIAKSLFQKGASAASRARASSSPPRTSCGSSGSSCGSCIGWQFTAGRVRRRPRHDRADGGALRLFVSPPLEAAAREHAQQADTGHQHHAAGAQLPWRERLRSAAAWSDVAHNFRGDWQMLWKEIGARLPARRLRRPAADDVFNALFVTDAPAAVQTVENVLVGPLIAVLSFVCSVGNVPLAAVLWAGGISFAGVIAFIFADLIVLPILADLPQVLRHGVRAAHHRADVRDDDAAPRWSSTGSSRSPGLIPDTRPAPDDVFGTIGLDYKLALNALAHGDLRRADRADRAARGDRPGLRDDRRPRARPCTLEVDGGTLYFCSEHCRHAYADGAHAPDAGPAPAHSHSH